MVITTQKRLPEHLKEALTQGLSPALLSQLRDHLNPLNTDILANRDLQKTYHDTTLVTLSRNYNGLSADIQVLREEVKNSTLVQRRIESCLTSTGSQRRALSPTTIKRTPNMSEAANAPRSSGVDSCDAADMQHVHDLGRSVPDSGMALALSSSPKAVCREPLREM